MVMCSSTKEPRTKSRNGLDILKKGTDLLKFQRPLVWRNIIGIFLIHAFGIYIFFIYPYYERVYTLLWGLIIGHLCGMGTTAGAHRLWTHRTYKARLPLRIWLMTCFLMSGQYSMVQWVRDHRLHHKYSDTDADPHNANRGFFFCHCGWLMMKRHPESKLKGQGLDLSDVWADPVVVFQQKYFVPLLIFFFIVVPCGVPMYFFGDPFWEVCCSMLASRYMIQLNNIWIVNSIAHFWGYKPYNKNIRAVDSRLLSLVAIGEGFHNYHHVFPWDYRAAEFGMIPNLTTAWINLYAKLGLAYDLKSCSKDMVQKVIARTGGDPHTEVMEEDVRKIMEKSY